MGDDFNNNYDSPRPVDSSYTRYSRSAGVNGYRRRRRQNKALKWVVGIILVVIIGGAGIMFGQRILDMPLLNPPEPSEESQASKEKDAEAISTAQPTQITLAAIGDVVINGGALDSCMTDNGGYDFTSLFAHVSSEVKEHDLRLVSQETNLPGDNYGYGAWEPLNAPNSLGDAEIAAGFNTILRASDHAMDNDTEGLHNEVTWWGTEHSKTPIIGITDPEAEEGAVENCYVNNIYMYEKDGFKVAVLNHTWGVEEDQTRFISALDEQKIATDVQRAKDEGAQIIVACPHWGDENNTEVTEEEMSFARVYADNGVDVIIGTHPRVLQRAEVLEGEGGHKTVCFYSLGCFVSSLNTENFVGGLAEVTLSRDDKGECSVTSAVLKPVVTYRANRGEYTTYLLSDYNDELGQTGWDYLMPDTASQMCIDTLGEGYSEEENLLRLV